MRNAIIIIELVALISLAGELWLGVAVAGLNGEVVERAQHPWLYWKMMLIHACIAILPTLGRFLG